MTSIELSNDSSGHSPMGDKSSFGIPGRSLGIRRRIIVIRNDFTSEGELAKAALQKASIGDDLQKYSR